MNRMKRIATGLILSSMTVTAFANPFSVDESEMESKENRDATYIENSDKPETSERETSDSSSQEERGGIQWFSLIACALGIAGVGLGGMAYIKATNLNDSLRNGNKSGDKALASLKKEIEEQRMRIYELERRIRLGQPTAAAATAAHIGGQSGHQEQPRSDVHPQSVAQTQTYHNETPKEVELFFGPPAGNSFSMPLQKYVAGKSLFKIVDNGAATATYTMIENADTVIIAKRSISRFVESGCVISGDAKESFTKIRTLKPGVVKRVGSSWTIVNKALVELI